MRALMRHFRRDLLWTEPDSRVAENVLLEAQRRRSRRAGFSTSARCCPLGDRTYYPPISHGLADPRRPHSPLSPSPAPRLNASQQVQEVEHNRLSRASQQLEGKWEQRFDALARLARDAGVRSEEIEGVRKQP